MSRCGVVLAVLLTGMLATVTGARAQDRPAPALEFAAGVLTFPDGAVTEGMFGGAGRFYLTPRVSVGPEIAFVQGEHHSHLMLTWNMTIDLLGPTSTGSRAITPFVVVGGGLFHSSEEFLGFEYSSNEGAFTSGGGVRVRATDRVFVGAEARVGWETHVRVNALVGVRLGP